MGHQLITVCIFCILCAAHSQCSSHVDIGNGHSNVENNSSTSDSGGGGGGTLMLWNKNKDEKKRIDPDLFITRVFEIFGDGKTLNHEGFGKLLKALHSEHLYIGESDSYSHDHTATETGIISGSSNKSKTSLHGDKCISSDRIVVKDQVTKETFKEVCPLLLYQFLPSSKSATCSHTLDSDDIRHTHVPFENTKNVYAVWLYATLSIIIISLCGLGGVIVIPVMKKVFYQKLLQFLVALAVGTLCGDALLHLLPHAMLSTQYHSHEASSGHQHEHSEEVPDNHDSNMWRGLVAMCGIIFLYFTEKFLTLIADCRKRRQRKNQVVMQRVRVMRDAEGVAGSVSDTATVGEKLCKHKYSSYPYCYGEITDRSDGPKNANGTADDGRNSTQKTVREENGVPTSKLYDYTKERSGVDLAVEREPLSVEKELDVNNETNTNEEGFTIILREHESAHHGHSHQHGHVHTAPTSLSSVAWMVIMGDGLHNFADGMAIGAAFAANISGGFSTALAVFCHELPHELGDFAVLLQAGMSAKQAVFYNLLSSVLCFVGMCLGVFLGHDKVTTQWVFSAAAGMFLYIALVDMIPELTSSHSKDCNPLSLSAIHFAGLMSGVGTMLLIALYEHDLKSVFVD